MCLDPDDWLKLNSIVLVTLCVIAHNAFFTAGQLKYAKHTSNLIILPQGYPCWLYQATFKVCEQTLASNSSSSSETKMYDCISS